MEKTLTQLPLADSEDLQPRQEKQSLPEQTEGSEEDRLERNRKMREWRRKNKEHYRLWRQERNRRNPERYKQLNRESYIRRKLKYADKLRDDGRVRGKKYRAKNSEKLALYQRERHRKNPEKKREQGRLAALRARVKRKLTETPEQKEARKAKARPAERARKKRKYYSDPAYRMGQIMRGRLSSLFSGQRIRKSKATMALVGCDKPELVKYIESRWQPGMSWENFGIGENKWSIDHIKPVTAFRLEEATEQQACFHYTNLEPKWWVENLAKGSMWNGRRWKHSDHALLANVSD